MVQPSGYGTGSFETIGQSGLMGGASAGAPSGSNPAAMFQQNATNYLASTAASNVWQNMQIRVGVGPKTPGVTYHEDHWRGGPIDDFSDHSLHVPGRHTPIMATPQQLLNDFDRWSRKDFLGFKNKLIAAGLLTSSTADPQNVRDMYSKILQNTVDQQSQGIMQTPMGYINNLIRLNGLNPGGIGSGSNYAGPGSGPKTQTATYKSVYDMDPAAAQLTLTKMLQQELGRDPSKQEIEDFADAVKTKALADPTETTVTTHRDAQGNITSNRSTDSGYTAADAVLQAKQDAQSAPDYKKYQAAATFFPAILQALRATA